jgi:hypothetical protein
MEQQTCPVTTPRETAATCFNDLEMHAVALVALSDLLRMADHDRLEIPNEQGYGVLLGLVASDMFRVVEKGRSACFQQLAQ